MQKQFRSSLFFPGTTAHKHAEIMETGYSTLLDWYVNLTFGRHYFRIYEASDFQTCIGMQFKNIVMCTHRLPSLIKPFLTSMTKRTHWDHAIHSSNAGTFAQFDPYLWCIAPTNSHAKISEIAVSRVEDAK